MGEAETIHASCVAIDGRGVLISGESGSGKSDLALRLIDRGAILVSDDYTRLEASGGMLVATAPPRIAGKIEVRGIGIVDLPHAASTNVALLVTLDGASERMPHLVTKTLRGIAIPAFALDATEASAPVKVELALAQQRVFA